MKMLKTKIKIWKEFNFLPVFQTWDNIRVIKFANVIWKLFVAACLYVILHSKVPLL